MINKYYMNYQKIITDTRLVVLQTVDVYFER